MNGISGKRVLITGGCGDIGQAVAKRFLEAGARVMLADLRLLEAGKKVAHDLHPSNAFYSICDIRDKASVEQTVAATAQQLGGLDVAISNAGCVANAPVLEVTLEDWKKTIDVNLTGSFLVGQAAARVMMQNTPSPSGHRGTIIFTGSWVQEMPWPEGASYCASKGGQAMLMKIMAQELAEHGITSNCVAPGMVYAGLTKAIFDRDPIFKNRVNQTVPLGRMSSAEEVAGSFLFLASDDGEYITGTTILVDGGASLVKR
jgi:NAD(P)-dependent dehydrogenase (short-subunit alcohol dehydrogenase family)